MEAAVARIDSAMMTGGDLRVQGRSSIGWICCTGQNLIMAFADRGADCSQKRKDIIVRIAGVRTNIGRFVCNFVLLMLFIPRADATYCTQQQRFDEAYRESTDILVGKVDSYPRFSTVYPIKVSTVYKGRASDEIRIIGNGLDYVLQPGAEYLIYAKRGSDSRSLQLLVCGRTRELSKASADIQKLEEIAAARERRRKDRTK